MSRDSRLWAAYPHITYSSPVMSYILLQRIPITCRNWYCNECYKLTKFCFQCHYNDVIMSAMASQITSLTMVYSCVYSGADQRKHQSSASLAFVRGIHRWPVNSPHKGPATRKMFPLDDVTMWKTTWHFEFNYILQSPKLWCFHWSPLE